MGDVVRGSEALRRHSAHCMHGYREPVAYLGLWAASANSRTLAQGRDVVAPSAEDYASWFPVLIRKKWFAIAKQKRGPLQQQGSVEQHGFPKKSTIGRSFFVFLFFITLAVIISDGHVATCFTLYSLCRRPSTIF